MEGMPGGTRELGQRGGRGEQLITEGCGLFSVSPVRHFVQEGGHELRVVFRREGRSLIGGVFTTIDAPSPASPWRSRCFWASKFAELKLREGLADNVRRVANTHTAPSPRSRGPRQFGRVCARCWRTSCQDGRRQKQNLATIARLRTSAPTQRTPPSPALQEQRREQTGCRTSL